MFTGLCPCYPESQVRAVGDREEGSCVNSDKAICSFSGQRKESLMPSAVKGGI